MYYVYVNVNPDGAPCLRRRRASSGGRRRPAGRLPAPGLVLQPPPAFAFDAVDLGQHGVDVLLLLHEARAPLAQHLDEQRELRALVAARPRTGRAVRGSPAAKSRGACRAGSASAARARARDRRGRGRAAPARSCLRPRRSGSRAWSARIRARARKSSRSAQRRVTRRAWRVTAGIALRPQCSAAAKCGCRFTIPYRVALTRFIRLPLRCPRRTPPILDYPFAAPPEPGTSHARGARAALAADAAAVRARPHQPVAARGAGRLHAGRHRLWRRADARAVGRALRDDDARAPARAHHRHALSSGPPRQRRVARGTASAVAVDDDAGGIPDRPRGHRRARGARSTPTPASCSAGTAWPPRTSPRSLPAATTTGAASRKCRRRCGGCWPATWSRAGGASWQVIPGYGHSPEHASLLRGDARRC